jgi:hypothetical protein
VLFSCLCKKVAWLFRAAFSSFFSVALLRQVKRALKPLLFGYFLWFIAADLWTGLQNTLPFRRFSPWNRHLTPWNNHKLLLFNIMSRINTFKYCQMPEIPRKQGLVMNGGS